MYVHTYAHLLALSTVYFRLHGESCEAQRLIDSPDKLYDNFLFLRFPSPSFAEYFFRCILMLAEHANQRQQQQQRYQNNNNPRAKRERDMLE